jgi:hypothetical protein
MSKNGLLEQLSVEDQNKVKEWAEKAKKPRYNTDIPPELFIGAKLGIYYGWEARVAYGRGYTIGIDEDGKLVQIPYTFDMAVADVKSAEKVLYRQMVDNGDIIAGANVACRSQVNAENAIKFANQIRKEISDV